MGVDGQQCRIYCPLAELKSGQLLLSDLVSAHSSIHEKFCLLNTALFTWSFLSNKVPVKIQAVVK